MSLLTLRPGGTPGSSTKRPEGDVLSEAEGFLYDTVLSRFAQTFGTVFLWPLTESADELNEMEWLKASLSNSAFAYLRDPEEDIYTINDGKPF